MKFNCALSAHGSPPANAFAANAFQHQYGVIARLLPAVIGMKDLDVDALISRGRFILIHELREREHVLLAHARCAHGTSAQS